MAKGKNSTLFDKGKHISWAMLIIFALTLVFVIVISHTGNNVGGSFPQENFIWTDGWLLPDGTEFSFPCADKQHDSITISKTLPEGLTERDSLVFSSGYQPIHVEVDGKPLDVVGTFEGRITYATAYSRVSLGPEMSGKEVKVTFFNQGGKQWMEIYTIKLGDLDLIRQAAFQKDFVTILSGTLLFAIALIVFILGFLQRETSIKVMNKRQTFVLTSSLITMFTIWMLVDTETVTLLLGSNPAYVFVNIFAFLFIMGPWLMQVILATNSKSVWLRVLALSGLIETLVIIVGVICGFFNFSIYLTISHLIGVLVDSSIAYLSFMAYKKRKDLGSLLLLIASALLIVMSCISGYTYYFTVTANNVSFMKYGILGYIIAMLYDLFVTFRNINRRYISEVEAARLAAEDANKAKSDFLSSMSHDIRTPMNAIMGFTTIASANADNKDVVKDSLHKISLSSRHLLGLINDILDMSKIESGKLCLTKAEISLSELMENLLNIIQPQIRSRNHKFDIVLEKILSENVYCDGVRLNQVLLNILSNAVKYTKDGGNILVTLRQENSPKGEKWVRTTFRVEDTGIGMTPEFLEHIFDSFARADNTHVNTTEGTGLGMSITKHIVDMMEGDISVTSSLGKGSTFVVTLDLERVTEKEQNLVLPPWNTLVVDDDKALCLSAVDTLTEMGINADWTQSGQEAVEMVDKKAHGLSPYNVVLLDWQMPNMDGIETARRIRARVGKDVPILLITAYDWGEIEQEARKAGINGFLSKPLFRSTLRCGLMQYVGNGGKTEKIEREDTVDFTGKRILIAEDNDINWEIAQNILDSYGFVVERAEDGLKCLQKFEQSANHHFDLVLMDIRMPHMDGYQSAEAIRKLQRPDATTVPILAMTADAFTEDIQRCLDAGMNGHVAKPLDIKALMRLIATHVK